MLVRYQDWKGKKILVTAADNPEQIFYHIETHLSKPNLVFCSASGSEIGSTTFHSLSSSIDFVVRGQQIQLNRKSLMSSTYTYSSPALNGATMTWSISVRLTKGFKYVCVDDKSLPVAKSSGASIKDRWNSIGHLELAEQYAHREDIRDEVAVIGWSLTHANLNGNV